MSHDNIQRNNDSPILELQPSVYNYIKHICDSRESDHASHLFAVVLDAIMLDNKFTPIQDGSNSGSDNIVVPASWTVSGSDTYKCRFKLIEYENCHFQLVAKVSHDMILVTLISLKTNFSFSKCYPLSKYINRIFICPTVFLSEDIKILSNDFRNNIIMPTRSYEMLASGFTNASLIGLPDEIIYRIMTHLGSIATVKLSMVSRRFRTIARRDALWRKFVFRDFKDDDLPDGVVSDWFDAYARCYKNCFDMNDFIEDGSL